MSVRNGAEGRHRVFAGTPEKVMKRRVIETVSAEGKPVYKAVFIQKEEVDNPDFSLKDGEILITHKKTSTDQERHLHLASCLAHASEIVVVVEALILLEDEFNSAFVSLDASRDFTGCLDVVMQTARREEKPTFSRFCFAFMEWIVGKPESVADLETFSLGGVLFTRVGEQVAAEHSDNEGLKSVACFNARNLSAWVSLYKTKMERHQMSHPFRFIGHDISVAEAGLDVLECVVHKEVYKEIYPLLQVAIPHVKKAIQNHQNASSTAKRQMESSMHLMASYLQRHKAEVDRKLREQEKADRHFPFDFVAGDD